MPHLSPSSPRYYVARSPSAFSLPENARRRETYIHQNICPDREADGIQWPVGELAPQERHRLLQVPRRPRVVQQPAGQLGATAAARYDDARLPSAGRQRCQHVLDVRLVGAAGDAVQRDQHWSAVG